MSVVEIGAVIAGKYRVERVLGQGGMGIVVVAMHDELDQRVAIKFLLREALRDVEWVARFAREARAAARIKSEHAVKVYDVGKLEDTTPYMVMEYLEGRDLQSTLNDRRQLPVSEAVDYLLQACEAIAEAHSAGIVHRDLKPANLFVTHRTDGSPCVKILDFGISKMTSLTDTKEQTVTNTRAIVGSPLYMSPEQMRASKNVDRRTDIWSLGVILQELVSGMPSFIANTTAELCALVLTAPPTPLRESMPNAPAGLDVVLAKCLAKSPDERYASVAELARGLEPFGPPSVRTSVERIVRLTASPAARAELTSIDREQSAPHVVVGTTSGAAGGPVAPTDAISASLSQTELVQPPLPQAVALPSVGEPPPVAVGAGTAAAWGSTQQPARKSRLLLYVGGAVGFGVLAAVAFAIVSRKTSTDATTSATPSMSVSAAVATATATETVTAPATTPATTTTATATTPATTTTAHVATARPPHPGATAPGSATGKKPPAGVDTAGFGGRN